MMQLKDVLKNKKGEPVTVLETSTVAFAIRTMHAKWVGSVMVQGADGGPVGILTERDILRLYAEGAGQGSLPDTVMGWVLGLVQNSQRLHTLHHLGMWAVVTFVLVHVYAAIREDILSRQSMISSMVSGERLFRDDLAD